MAVSERGFEHLREHSIGLPGVLFQSVTHMAPGAAIAFSILVSVQFAGPALPLSVLFALIACLLVANSIGQLAKQIPSAGGLYAYVSHALGPRAGFFTAWAFLLFEPLVFPFIVLVFATAVNDVFVSELSIDVGWGTWVLVGTAIVFLLTYRDVRLSTGAGVVLGVFEIVVFAALAIWMLISNAGSLDLRAFDPGSVPGNDDFNGVFKGMVFAVLAFIGFEAAAPLGEEAKHPRWTIPRAVVLSALSIGLLYVLASYAWVYGAGFDQFVDQATGNADPWRALATVFWSGGWVLVFVAIANSAIANANAAVNAASRVLYAMARNGAAPRRFGHTHQTFRTPHVAIIANAAFGAAVALLLGAIWGPVEAFSTIGTAVTVVVIVIYMLLCLGTFVFYRRQRPDEFRPLVHAVFPLLGAVAFAFPLYYQYTDPPDYPMRWGNWFALAWLVAGIGVTAWVAKRRPQALETADRVFVEDETVEPERARAPA